MTELPRNDTTMTDPNPLLSQTANDRMTELLKSGLRVRARRLKSQSSVIVSFFFFLFFFYDISDRSFKKKPSRGCARTRTRPRDLGFIKTLSFCHNWHQLHAGGRP